MARPSIGSLRALRASAAAFAASIGVAACTTVLGPRDFDFVPCVADTDCPRDQACSADNRCAPANGRICGAPAEGAACASGFCAGDGVCCAKACGGPCHSCAGGAACSLVSAGAQGACMADHVCNEWGACHCPTHRLDGPPETTFRTGSLPRALAALDVDGDALPDLVVVNTGDDTVGVLRNLGNGLFATPVDYAAPAPGGVVGEDVNHDGKVDLIVGKGSGAVSVLLNNGDGTFAPRVEYAAGSGVVALAAADLSDDGRPDLAVLQPISNTVTVLFNGGDGSFAIAGEYPTCFAPVAVAATDLNNDGKTDLAISCAAGGGGPADLSVLLNHGDGTFASKVDYPIGSGAYALVATDLDGDGRPDLAVPHGAFAFPFPHKVSVLRNLGDGTFAARVDYDTCDDPSALQAADVNGDGKADLVAASASQNLVSVLLNDGAGAFPTHIDFLGDGNPISLVTSDFDRDSKPDLAATNHLVDKVSVWRNGGDGTFGPPPSTYPLRGSPYAVAMGDLDADGKSDVVTATVVSPASLWSGVNVLLSNGDGTLGNAVHYATPDAFDAALADLNGDGKLDLAITTSSGPYVAVNQGDGTFGAPLPALPSSLASTAGVVVADLNGDGKPDLAVTLPEALQVMVLFNHGNATFAAGAPHPAGDATGAAPWSIVAGDLDGDGKLDLVIGNRGFIGQKAGKTVSVLLNKGDGTFADKVDYAGFSPVSVAALDLNGDGKPDLAVPNNVESTVSVLFNKGDGTFADKADYPTAPGPNTVVAVDLNGDGALDLAVSTWSGVVTELLNKGDGTFADKVDTYSGGGYLAAGDLDGDGKPDLAIATTFPATLAVLMNQCPSQ